MQGPYMLVNGEEEHTTRAAFAVATHLYKVKINLKTDQLMVAVGHLPFPSGIFKVKNYSASFFIYAILII